MVLKTPEFEPGGYWSVVLGTDLALGCWAKVYYRVYGSWGGWSRQNGPVPRALTLAKKSQTLRRYTDDLLHKVIGLIVKRTQSGQRLADNDALYARLRERIAEEISYSAAKRWESVDNPGRAVLILERHLIGGELKEEEVKAATDQTVEGLTSFMKDHLPQIRSMPVDFIDLPSALKGFEHHGFRLFSAPDLVLVSKGEWTVIDYRLSKRAKPEQLAFDALALTRIEEQDRMRCIVPNQIIGKSVPLLAGSDAIETVQMSEDLLLSAAAHIDEDIEALMARRADGIAGKESSFPKTEDLSICATCCFRFQCRPGWEDD